MNKLCFSAKDFDGLVEYVSGEFLRSAGVPMDNRFSLAAHVYTTIATRAQKIYNDYCNNCVEEANSQTAKAFPELAKLNNDEESDGN